MNNRPLTFALWWTIYAAIIPFGIGTVGSSRSISEAIGNLLAPVVLPYLAGGFASGFGPIRVIAYVAGILFIVSLVVPKLRYRSLSKFSFALLVGTSLFAIWIDKYLSIESALYDLAIGFLTGGLFRFLDIGVTVGWLIFFWSVNCALDEAGPQSPTFLKGLKVRLKFPRYQPFAYGILMFAVAFVLGQVAMAPLITFVASANHLIHFVASSNHLIVDDDMRRETVYFAAELGALLAFVPLVYLGSLQDRFGLRLTMLAGLIGLGFATIFSALTMNVAMIFVSGFLLNLFGLVILLTSANLLSYWYDKGLGLMEGARILTFPFVAMAILPNFLTRITDSGVSWRVPLMFFGAGLAVLLAPAMYLVVRNRPEDVNKTFDGDSPSDPDPAAAQESTAALAQGNVDSPSFMDCLRRADFWLLAIGLALVSGLVTWAFKQTYDLFHVNGYDVVLLYREFAIFVAIGGLIGGMAVDIVSKNDDRLNGKISRALLPLSLVGCSFAIMVLLEILPLFTPLSGYRLAALFSGVFLGGIGPHWARYFGRAHLGKLRGILLTCSIVGYLGFVQVSKVAIPWLGPELSFYLMFAIFLVVAAGIFATVRLQTTARPNPLT